MNPCSKTTVARRGEGRQLRRARQWGRCGGQRAPPNLHLRFKLQLHPAGRPHSLGLSQVRLLCWVVLLLSYCWSAWEVVVVLECDNLALMLADLRYNGSPSFHFYLFKSMDCISWSDLLVNLIYPWVFDRVVCTWQSYPRLCLARSAWIPWTRIHTYLSIIWIKLEFDLIGNIEKEMFHNFVQFTPLCSLSHVVVQAAATWRKRGLSPRRHACWLFTTECTLKILW